MTALELGPKLGPHVASMLRNQQHRPLGVRVCKTFTHRFESGPRLHPISKENQQVKAECQVGPDAVDTRTKTAKGSRRNPWTLGPQLGPGSDRVNRGENVR
jgi:hypothetical protein